MAAAEEGQGDRNSPANLGDVLQLEPKQGYRQDSPLAGSTQQEAKKKAE
jgi:hypothetical protein